MIINDVNYEKKGDKMFLNIDKYDYPRANETLKQLHKQQWLNYYKCLEETYATISRKRISYPTALTALEGTSVTLDHQKK